MKGSKGKSHQVQGNVCVCVPPHTLLFPFTPLTTKHSQLSPNEIKVFQSECFHVCCMPLKVEQDFGGKTIKKCYTDN